MDRKLAQVVEHFIEASMDAVTIALQEQQHADAILKLHEEKRKLVDRRKEETAAVKIQAVFRGRHVRVFLRRRQRRMSFGEIQGERLDAVLKAAGVELFSAPAEAELIEIRQEVKQHAIENGCELKVQKDAFVVEVAKRVREDSGYRNGDSEEDDPDPDSEEDDPEVTGWIEQQV